MSKYDKCPKRNKQLTKCLIIGQVLLEYPQHSPSSCMSPLNYQVTSKILKSQQFDKTAEFDLHKQFGEYISWVLICWYIFNHDFSIFNSFSDKMIVDIDVLGLVVEFAIFWLPPGCCNWVRLAYLI